MPSKIDITLTDVELGALKEALEMSLLTMRHHLALRLGSELHQRFVATALSVAAQGMLAVLPALRNQEAIISGEGVSVPMRVQRDDLRPAAGRVATVPNSQRRGGPAAAGGVMRRGARRRGRASLAPPHPFSRGTLKASVTARLPRPASLSFGATRGSAARSGKNRAKATPSRSAPKGSSAPKCLVK